MAVKCAVVSRWACKKRRRKNSPCLREDDSLNPSTLKNKPSTLTHTQGQAESGGMVLDAYAGPVVVLPDRALCSLDLLSFVIGSQ